MAEFLSMSDIFHTLIKIYQTCFLRLSLSAQWHLYLSRLFVECCANTLIHKYTCSLVNRRLVSNWNSAFSAFVPSLSSWHTIRYTYFSFRVRPSFLLLVWLCISYSHMLSHSNHRTTSHEMFPTFSTMTTTTTTSSSSSTTTTTTNRQTEKCNWHQNGSGTATATA